jgi:hypothetical protein
MSHFTVLVIGDNPEKQLAPYGENIENCPEECVKFVDVEDEERLIWKTETVERVVMPDGRLLSPFDDTFKIESWRHEVPKHLKKKEVPFTELYPKFEDYIEEYVGYTRDSQRNRYGYWANPNAKWDWYSLGGRWTGFFKLKKNSLGLLGEPGILTEPAEIGHVDQCRWGMVDIDGMRKETFAVVKNGKWYEQGEMGWFAFVSNEKSDEVWSKEFNSLLEDLHPDTLVSLYDCHI